MGKARYHFDIFQIMPCGRFMLHQVGDLCCEQDYTVPQHHQALYEFSLIVAGKAEFFINEEEYQVEKGDLILTIPGDNHSIVSDDASPMHMLYIAFAVSEEHCQDASSYRDLEKRLKGTGDRIVSGHYDLSASFFKLLNEIQQKGEFSADLIEAYVNEIIILCCRSILMKEQYQAYTVNPPHTSGDRLVYNIISLLDSQNTRVENLSSIGKRVGYSYSYLSQVFSKKVGMSIMDYFHSRLFEKAIRELSAGASVTTVADKLGYTSIHNFSRAFTNYFGVPPSRFSEIEPQRIENIRMRLELAKSRLKEDMANDAIDDRNTLKSQEELL